MSSLLMLGWSMSIGSSYNTCLCYLKAKIISILVVSYLFLNMVYASMVYPSKTLNPSHNLHLDKYPTIVFGVRTILCVT
jgi:hypothetical protein